MQRFQSGIILTVSGLLSLIISFFMLLMLTGFYLISLFIMFLSVVEIAVGFAYAKGVDCSLDTPHDECYYCNGLGMIDSETCPRCGGTGLARADD